MLCGRGNNGGDGFVVARTLLQRGVDVSVFLIGRVAEVRGDARINLEILGRLGLTVVEVADSQAWELHFSEVSDCTLIVDAIFGTGLNAPLAGPDRDGRRRRQRLGDSRRRDRSAVRALGRFARSDRRLHRGGTDRHARRAEAAARAAAGRDPRRRHRDRRYRHSRRGARRARGAAHRAPDARGDARTHARRGRRTRTRATTAAFCSSPGSRGKTGAAHLAAVGALRSGAGLVTVATPAPLPGDRRGDGAGVHDRGARRDADGIDLRTRRSRDRDGARRHRDRARPRAGAGDAAVRQGAGRSRDGAARGRCRRLERVRGRSRPARGREGRDVIITPHPGEMARLLGMSADEVQASRLEIARNFAVAHHVLRRAEGPPHAHRDAGREGLHQPDGQSRNGDRRHRRRAHRDDRRLARAAARRGSRVQAGRLPARHGRRPRGGRRGRSGDDLGRRRRPPRRRRPRAHRAPPGRGQES